MILLRYGVEGKLRAFVLGQKIKAFAQAGEHPERQNIDFQDAERVNIILVPFDHRAILHRGILDRAQLIQPPARDDEPADMLAQMTREADDLANEFERLRQTQIRRIKTKRPDPIHIHARAGHAPDVT